MRTFSYERAANPGEAVHAATAFAEGNSSYLAGGTTLIDLMKLDVMRPDAVVDINPLHRTRLGHIELTNNGLRLGALVRWRRHPILRRCAINIRSSPNHCSSQPASNSATWRASAVTCCNARAARISATLLTRSATNGFPVPAAPPSAASTAGTPCSAPASIASRPMPGILRKL